MRESSEPTLWKLLLPGAGGKRPFLAVPIGKMLLIYYLIGKRSLFVVVVGFN